MFSAKRLPVLCLLCLMALGLIACSGESEEDTIDRFFTATEAVNSLSTYHCVTTSSTTASNGEEALARVQEFWANDGDYLCVSTPADGSGPSTQTLFLDGTLYLRMVDADTTDDWRVVENFHSTPWVGVFSDRNRKTELLSVEKTDDQEVIQILSGEAVIQNQMVTSPITLTITLDAEQTVVRMEYVYTMEPQEGTEDYTLTAVASTEFLPCTSQEIDAILHSQLEEAA